MEKESSCAEVNRDRRNGLDESLKPEVKYGNGAEEVKGKEGMWELRNANAAMFGGVKPRTAGCFLG